MMARKSPLPCEDEEDEDDEGDEEEAEEEDEDDEDVGASSRSP